MPQRRFGPAAEAQEDWNKATTANTVAAYQDYLSKHPTGDHSTEASEKIHALQDDQAWSHSQKVARRSRQKPRRNCLGNFAINNRQAKPEETEGGA